MKERTKGIIVGALAAALLTGGTVGAKKALETISVTYDDIKVYMDGELLELKDANGNTVDPFIYNGTTFLPVRAIGENFGKDVSWDGVNKVVYLGAKQGETENWLNACGPYQYSYGEEFHIRDNKYFTMSGKNYTNGFVLGHHSATTKAFALFNLDGKFKSVSFTVGHIDGTLLKNGKLNIYIDGVISYTKDLNCEDVASKVEIPLDGALQMKIEIVNSSANTTKWGFSEGEFVELD